jgi:hypothetical protein
VKAKPVKVGPVKAGPVKTNATVNAKIERRVFMAFTPLALDLRSDHYTAIAAVGLDLTARRENPQCKEGRRPAPRSKRQRKKDRPIESILVLRSSA